MIVIDKINKPLKYFVSMYASIEDEVDIRIEIDFPLNIGDYIHFEGSGVDMEKKVVDRWIDLNENHIIYGAE